MSVTQAQIRLPTTSEAIFLRGGCLWRYGLAPVHFVNKIAGITQMILYRNDFLNIKTPQPLRFSHNITKWLGWTPEKAFISDLPCFGGSWHMFSQEAEVYKAILSHHRQGMLLKIPEAFSFMKDILDRTFPEIKFDDGDFILTCGQTKSLKFRALIAAKMHSEVYTPKVARIIDRAIERLRTLPEPIDITHECRRLASSIIIKVMFDQDIESDLLAKSVHTISSYVIKKLVGKATKEDEKAVDDAAAVFRDMANQVLKPLEGMSEKETLAFIFALFFAGQETTSSLLNFSIYYLGTHQDEQQKIREEPSLKNLSEIVEKSLKQFPPIYGLTRQLKETVCFEYVKDNKTHKIIFPSDDYFSLDIRGLAEEIDSYAFQFGFGEHECPGKHLAKREIKVFLTRLVEEFEFEVANPEPLKVAATIILELSENVLIRRKPVRKNLSNPLLEPIS
jgi:hypothetical protein